MGDQAMKIRSYEKAFMVAFLVCVVALCIIAPSSFAQSASTGALAGTVTDPSGGVIAGATVTVTNLATGQTRTASTNSSGSYQLSLLPPSNYSVRFEAPGFKTVEVPSVVIDVTETPTLNRKLEIGPPSQKVTVEATSNSIQIDNVSNGGVISGEEIQSLPLVTRNYTQIVDLSPGVVANVANATAMGNGTQNVSSNGQAGNSNSYSMDGANITQYTSGGAAQTGSFAGIAIPNPDTIQEFKVQTSQYDAAYGRNPGANVEVITKGGSNTFHGSIFEYNRNNFFNANDFFYKRSELNNNQPNSPQTLKQNTFGGTIGGPIKKDKLFFFFSYQGFRQLNGIATNGFATGYEPSAHLMPWNDYADFDAGNCADLRCTNNIPAYRAYLGSVFGPGAAACPGFVTTFGVPSAFPAGTPSLNCNQGYADGVLIQNNGAQISNTAIALLQAHGGANPSSVYNQGGYWIAGAPRNCPLTLPASPATGGVDLLSSGCQRAISDPTIANENQYLGNSDWVINSKNTLQERFLYQEDPQVQQFDCLLGDCNPGSPADVLYQSWTGTLRLTTILTSNLINEARFTFQRNLENATDPNPLMACNLPNGGSIIPLNNDGQPCSANVPLPIADFGIVPSIDVLNLYSPSGSWSQGGNFAGTGTNIVNTFQAGDQVSWNHGIHNVRAGFDLEKDQYNNTTPASGRGEVLFDNVADFLTASSGTSIPGYNDGPPQTGLPPGGGVPVTACGFFFSAQCGGGASPIALRGLLTHYNRIGAYEWFVQDDIKVKKNLTVNVGLRWEYDGWPSDKIGQFTNVWTNRLAMVNAGSYYLGGGTSLQGFVVPKNYDKSAGLVGPDGSTGVLVNGNNTLFSGSPLNNFMPRLGVAWQPFGRKLVVRAGYAWYYDREGSTFLVDGQLNLPPYSGTATGSAIQNLENTLHSPFQAVAGAPLTWTPRFLTVPAGFLLNGYNAVGALNYSALGYTANSNQMSNHLPLTQAYGLDFQYDLGHGWVADIGYQGSHSIHVLNQGTPVNVAHLVDCGPASQTCNAPTFVQDIGMLNNPNFPGGNPIPFNDAANTTPVTLNTTQNLPARVSYLGYTSAALSTTNNLGDALYNSLQAQIRHNFSHGMLLQASYTWSKNLTNVNAAESGELDTGQTDYGTTGSNNPLDLAQQFGPYSGQRSQRLIVSYSYSIPWKSTEGISGHVLSGWAISGITTIQNGQPLTVTDTGGGSIYGGSTSRALLANPVNCRANGNCNSGVKVSNPGSTTQRVLSGLPGSPTYDPINGGWINGNAFSPFSGVLSNSPYCIGGVYTPGGSPLATCGAAPSPFDAPGTPGALGSDYLGAGTGWGNAPVGIINGPGQFNWDFSIQKNTKIKEWGTLQFRTEFYNLWNHPQFSNPVSSTFTGTPGGTFGQINSTSVAPRVIQFGLHFNF
jgi:Carboxypeptidase regulatory-like domain